MSGSMVTWRPLLDGDDRDRALAMADALADEIDRRAIDDPSLAFGQAGIAILHGYRARAGRADGADRAFAALERSLDNLAAARGPWLFRGLAGVAFAIHDLGELAGDATDVLAELDALIARGLDVDARHAWDLTDGVIGLGVYGLARGLPRLIDGAVACLVEIVERGPDGAAWRTREAAYPDGYFNLGLAHGVACAIALLAEAHAAGHVRDHALIGDAVRWLRARERDGVVPRVPMYEGDVDFARTVDGWCYGDPSTALVLVRAGAALGEPAWREAGHALALHAARRTERDLAPIAIDASLCHGAISQAHLFARLGRALDDAELDAAARRWYARVIDTDVAAIVEPGLQLGKAGVALGLYAAATDVEPTWDRAFLLSGGAIDALR